MVDPTVNDNDDGRAFVIPAESGGDEEEEAINEAVAAAPLVFERAKRSAAAWVEEALTRLRARARPKGGQERNGVGEVRQVCFGQRQKLVESCGDTCGKDMDKATRLRSEVTEFRSPRPRQQQLLSWPFRTSSSWLQTSEAVLSVRALESPPSAHTL